MKFFTICRLLVVISVGAVLVQGCSKNSGAADTEEDTDRAFLRSQLKTCIKYMAYDSSIDFYVSHSRWFALTESTTCASGDDDAKVTCWEDALDDILPEYHTLYSTLKSCISSYKTAATAELPMKKRVLRSTGETLQRATRVPDSDAESGSESDDEVEVYDDMVGCPKISTAQFKSGVGTVPTFTDSEIEELADAFQDTFTCSKDFCDCTSITTAVPQFTGVSHCNTCWYLKLADSIKADSNLKLAFSEVAVDLTEKTNIVCTPQTRIVLDSTVVSEMEITDIDSQLYLGKHEICYPGDPDAVTELDDECKATTVDGSSGEYAKFNVATDKCSLDTDREIITDDGFAYQKFKYIVTKIPTIATASPIQRYTCAEKKFECLIPVNQKLKTGVVTPEIQDITSTEVTGESAYQLDFTIGTQSPVEVGQDISVAISLVNVVTPANYRLNATNCFAKPEDESTEYPIIDCHGCKVDNSYDDTDDITLTKNAEVGGNVEFTFKAFTWTGKAEEDQQIFIHCDVNVCDNVAETCDAATICPSTDACPRKRFRRGLPTSDDTRLSFGPILVKRKSEGIVHPHKIFSVML